MNVPVLSVVESPPGQKTKVPVITGEGTGFNVMVLLAVPSQPLAAVTVTVYVPAVLTVRL